MSAASGPVALSLRQLSTADTEFPNQLQELLHWDLGDDSTIDQTVAAIIASVKAEGDAALLRHTSALDNWAPNDIQAVELNPEEFAKAYAELPKHHAAALQQAADRIRSYHEHQLGSDFEFTDALGNRLGQRVTPLDSVGLYVPGGQAAYPSTVLMTGLVAKVAGVAQLIMCTPTPGGTANPMVLAAAHLAQVDRAFAVGGAQAVAALAYGSTGIPRVDKIVGPGGAYVAAAKRQVYGQVGIDSIAGPSEVLILTDGTAPLDWLLLDLFSQAEHDAAAQAILISPDAAYLQRASARLAELLVSRERRTTITESLNARGAFIHTRSLAEAIELVNKIAPEHLQLAVANPRELLADVRHAGAVFLGARTGEVLGDYVAGPSHVLPTFGTARFSSPLSVYDFQKRSSIIEVSAIGAEQLGQVAATLADTEGLEAHASAARLRVQVPPVSE